LLIDNMVPYYHLVKSFIRRLFYNFFVLLIFNMYLINWLNPNLLLLLNSGVKNSVQVFYKWSLSKWIFWYKKPNLSLSSVDQYFLKFMNITCISVCLYKFYWELLFNTVYDLFLKFKLVNTNHRFIVDYSQTITDKWINS